MPFPQYRPVRGLLSPEDDGPGTNAGEPLIFASGVSPLPETQPLPSPFRPQVSDYPRLLSGGFRAPVAPIEEITVATPMRETVRQADRYFDRLYRPLSDLARDINVPEEIVIGHALKEGGWDVGTQENDKNNVFGLNRRNVTIPFETLEKSIDAFRNGWGQRLVGKGTIDEYISELHRDPEHQYNDVDRKYDTTLRKLVRDGGDYLAAWKARRSQ